MERAEIDSTMPRFTASSAISHCVHCVLARPLSCGASQASAMIARICSGLKVAGVPERGASDNRSATLAGVLRPSSPPPLDGRATDAESIRRRPHADPLTRQQANPRPQGQLLWTGRLSLDRLQLLTLAIGDRDRGRTKQRHRKNPKWIARYSSRRPVSSPQNAKG